MHSIKLYYDKDCPFCSNYANYLKLKNSCSLVVLNAREHKMQIDKFYKDGFDINDGFIILIDEKRVMQGSQALLFLEKYSKRKISIFKNEKLTPYIYNIIKVLRKLLLFLLRKDANIRS